MPTNATSFSIKVKEELKVVTLFLISFHIVAAN